MNDVPKPKKRIINQNNALPLYCEMISETLNSLGIDVRLFLEVLDKNGIDTQFTPHLVKELIWRRVQRKLLDKRSPAQLNKTDEINLIVDALNRFFSKYFGEIGYEFLPFPSIETLETKFAKK